MRYLLLLANAPDAWHADSADSDDSADDGVIEDWSLYTAALREAGVLVGGAALRGPDTATTVRLHQGRRLVTDGAYAETTEDLLGYYLIEVPTLDEALAWAARVPNVRTGSVEVRPVTPGSEVVP